jgi:hypothetical protein
MPFGPWHCLKVFLRRQVQARCATLTRPRRSAEGARSVLPMRRGRSDSCPSSPTTRRHPAKATRKSTGEGACHLRLFLYVLCITSLCKGAAPLCGGGGGGRAKRLHAHQAPSAAHHTATTTRGCVFCARLKTTRAPVHLPFDQRLP